MQQIYDMGPTASAGFEPANLGTKGQHATSRQPKPLYYIVLYYIILCYNNTIVLQLPTVFSTVNLYRFVA